MTKIKLAWHLHHKILIEPLIEPIEVRIAYIKACKPRKEQELRLRLLKLVKGRLPAAFIQAAEVYAPAWKAHVQAAETYVYAYVYAQKNYAHAIEAMGTKEQREEVVLLAWKACIQIEDAFIQAYEDAKPEILALHAEECPNCPWDGSTIFPTKLGQP